MRTSILLVVSTLLSVLVLPAQREVDFLREQPLQWGAAGAGSGARARAAVLVMADRYETKLFDAPSAKRSGEVLRDALVQHGGFARGAIRELSGEQVHEGALESAIRAAAASIGDGAGVKEGTLLVLWVGHGFTAGSGPTAEQELFTYYTAASGDGFAPTLGLRKLNGWLDAAHTAAKQRGVDLAIALVMDACKPNIKAPPRNAKLVSSKAWQISSATDGQFALGRGPDEPMLFSQAFADALARRAAQSGAADLQQVFLEARDQTLQRSQNAQRPQLLEPSDAELAKRKLAVVVPRRVGFTVRLVDALAGGRIEQAKLRLDDQLHEVREHRLSLAAAPGTHQLELQAEGYLTRAEVLTLGDEQADREVAVPLFPHVAVLRARVSPPRVVELKVAVDGARAGYHVLTTTTDAKGEAELRLPAAPSYRLQVLRAGRELQAQVVDVKPSAWLRDQTGQHTGIPLLEASVALGKVALEAIGDDLGVGVADAPKERPTLAGLDASEWQLAQQNMARERWDLARTNLQNIEANSAALASWLRYVEARWARGALERALAEGKRSGDWSAADEVVDWWGKASGQPEVGNRAELERLVAELQRERVPLAVRKGFDAGNQAYAAGELEKALGAYEAARPQANEHFGKRIDEQVADIKARLYVRHVAAGNQHEADGDKAKARASYTEALKYSERAKRYLAKLGEAAAPAPAPTVTPSVAPATANQRLETGVGLAMIRIEAQEFVMGSPPSEAGRDEDEPQHRVKITKPYWIGETEVTRKQWREVMGTAPWGEAVEGDDIAATHLSWSDAMEFCRKLTERERAGGRLPAGYRYILPTEAEWELACRAGSKTAYCFGDDVKRLDEYAVFGEARLGAHAHRIKQRRPNAWGLYDMHGNVWEWCLDRADWTGMVLTRTYREEVEDPYQVIGSRHLTRGGSWGNAARYCRSADRSTSKSSDTGGDFGLRLALAARSDLKTVTIGGDPAAARAAASLWLETGIGLAMIKIEAQEFVMGSPANEAGRSEHELQHRVLITKPYWIGESEVTRKQWREVMGTTPWSAPAEGDDTAATHVSWSDAMEFCRKLTELERAAGRLPAGYRYILPTEAEWELACRAGSKTAYCFGDDVKRLGDYAVFGEARTGARAHLVKQCKPNAWGLYDMHGNVWEWCLDAHEKYSGDAVDPAPLSGSLRVLRGGSWFDVAQFCRSADRNSSGPAGAGGSLGFRPALAARSDVK